MAATLALGGCSMIPEMTLPGSLLPEAWRNAAPAPVPAPVPAEAPSPTWWRAFNSPELNGLEDMALAGNFDLKAAVARVTQAARQAEVAGAGLWPTLSAAADAQRLKQSTTSRTSLSSSRISLGNKSVPSYRAALDASYELDFWGKNQATAEAAQATARASVFDRDTVATTLAATVATTYFQVLSLTERLAAARELLANARSVLSLVTTRAEAGAGSGLEVAQQRSAVALQEAGIPALELERARAMDSLTTLIGVPPGAVRVDGTGLGTLSLPTVAPGLPSELLHRRPDIRRAEFDLIAANADIGKARAALFPSIQLSGERGYSSRALSTLLQPSSALYTLAANLTAPIFDGGRLRGAVAVAEARREELTQTYLQAIVNALRDVEDALAASRWTAEQEAAQTAAVASAREASRLAETRYRDGLVDYATVLDTQRTLLQSRDTLVTLRLARLDAAVGLFKALGGGVEGWSDERPSPP
ncbi:MAG: efflux transporter outer membrane subunit [Alphaproteobacteria bacterium]